MRDPITVLACEVRSTWTGDWKLSFPPNPGRNSCVLRDVEAFP